VSKAPNNSRDRTVDVVIEIPRGSRSKYEFDEKIGRLRMKRVLSLSVVYPTDYGFVPDTLAGDGDPLDALLLSFEPAVPGSVQLARPIGMLDMADHNGPDAKVLMPRAEYDWINSGTGNNANVQQLMVLARELLGKPKYLQLVDVPPTCPRSAY